MDLEVSSEKFQFVPASGVYGTSKATWTIIIQYSTMICKSADLIPALHQLDCGFLIGSVLKNVHSSSTSAVKLPHTSGHSSGNRQGHVTK